MTLSKAAEPLVVSSPYHNRQLLLPPKLGMIKKGAPKSPGGAAGKDLDYFRFASGDVTAIEAWKLAYPAWVDANKQDRPAGQPRRLDILFPFADPNMILSRIWGIFTDGGILHACDDDTEQVLTQYDTATKKYVTPTGSCPYRTGVKPRTDADPGCKRKGSFVFYIPALAMLGEIGYVEMDLSEADIDTMRATLEAAKSLLDNYNYRTGNHASLSNVPFVLSRCPTKTSKNTPEGLMRGINWALRLKIDPHWTVEHLLPNKQLLKSGYELVAPKEVKLLESPVEETDDVIDGTIIPLNANTKEN